MLLAEVLSAREIRTDLVAADKDEALHALARLFVSGDGSLEEARVYEVLAARERVGTTGVGGGVAIPHAQLPIGRFRLALAVSREGVPFDTLDGEPAHVVVGVLAPLESSAAQLKLVARIARVLRDHAVYTRLRAAESAEAALEIVTEEELRH